MYDNLSRLIETSGVVLFNKQNAVSDLWIQKAETALGLSLPPSYKWWLQTYGGGRIGADDIFTILQIDFDEAAGPDIVFNAQVNRENNISDETHLYICEAEGDESWYFDVSSESRDGEYPVYMNDQISQTSSLYAKSFDEFLERKINEHLNVKSPQEAAQKWIAKRQKKNK